MKLDIQRFAGEILTGTWKVKPDLLTENLNKLTTLKEQITEKLNAAITQANNAIDLLTTVGGAEDAIAMSNANIATLKEWLNMLETFYESTKTEINKELEVATSTNPGSVDAYQAYLDELKNKINGNNTDGDAAAASGAAAAATAGNADANGDASGDGQTEGDASGNAADGSQTDGGDASPADGGPGTPVLDPNNPAPAGETPTDGGYNIPAQQAPNVGNYINTDSIVTENGVDLYTDDYRGLIRQSTANLHTNTVNSVKEVGNMIVNHTRLIKQKLGISTNLSKVIPNMTPTVSSGTFGVLVSNVASNPVGSIATTFVNRLVGRG